MRNIIQPTKDDHGDERHPAWGMIGASRVSSSPPGAVLFDSDIRHQHYVVVTLGEASRTRNLLRDWLRRRKTIVEVALSEAQWASFVSSMNSGDGVPCTIQAREGVGHVPGLPYEPRLQESMEDVRNAADKAVADVAAKFDALAQAFEAGAGKKAMREAIHSLKYAVQNMPANVTFAAESLSEYAENVVQRSRADIEAMVISKAKQMGIEPGDLGMSMAELTAGDEGGQ